MSTISNNICIANYNRCDIFSDKQLEKKMVDKIKIGFDPDKTIIKQIRETVRLSQAKLAKLLNVSQPLIAYLERKRSKINLNKAVELVAVAAKLNIIIKIDDIKKDYF